jgi:hypothetical protein
VPPRRSRRRRRRCCAPITQTSTKTCYAKGEVTRNRMKGSLPEADAWRSMAAEVAAGGGGNNPMKNIQAPMDFPASEKATMSQHAPRRSSLTTLRTSIGDAGQGQLRRRSGSRCSLSLSLRGKELTVARLL